MLKWTTHEFKLLIFTPNENINQHYVSLPITPKNINTIIANNHYVLPVAQKNQSKIPFFIDEKAGIYEQKFVKLPITILVGFKNEFLKINWIRLKQAVIFCLGMPRKDDFLFQGQPEETKDHFVVLIISLKNFLLFKSLPLIPTVNCKNKALYFEDFRKRFKYATNLKPYTYFIVNNSIVKPMSQFCSNCSNFFEKFLKNDCGLFLHNCVGEITNLIDPDLTYLDKIGVNKPISQIVGFNPRTRSYDLSLPLAEIESKTQKDRFIQQSKAQQRSHKLRKYCCSFCDFYLNGAFACKYNTKQLDCNGPYQIFNEPWETVAKRLFKPWELHILTLFNKELPKKKAATIFSKFKQHLLKYPAIIKFPLRSLEKLTFYTLYEVNKAKDQFVLILSKKEIIIIPYEEFCRKFGYKVIKNYEEILQKFYKTLKPYLQKETENRILITVLMNLKFKLKNFKTGYLLFRSNKPFNWRYDFLENSLIRFYGLEDLFSELRKDLRSDPYKEKFKIKKRVIFQNFKPTREDYFGSVDSAKIQGDDKS